MSFSSFWSNETISFLSLMKISELRHLHGSTRKLCKTLIIRITAVWQCLPMSPANLRSSSLLHTIVRETSRYCKWRRWNIYKFIFWACLEEWEIRNHPMLVGKVVKIGCGSAVNCFLLMRCWLVLICASYFSFFLLLMESWQFCAVLYLNMYSFADFDYE